MLYIVCALKAEAQPLIERFGLKQEPQQNRFQLFHSEHVRLIVSGTGETMAAIATTYLLANRSLAPSDIIVNVGTCGTQYNDITTGDALIPHKIIHHDTQKHFYPDIIVDHGLREGSVETFSRPVGRDEASIITGDGVDMEASGFFQAASVFSAPHQILLFKVVSDVLSYESLTPSDLTTVIKKNTPALIAYCEKVHFCLSEEHNPVFTPEEQQLLQYVGDQLRLSVTLTHEFHRLAQQYKVMQNKDLEFLRSYTHLSIESKREGKMHYDSIKRKLLAP